MIFLLMHVYFRNISYIATFSNLSIEFHVLNEILLKMQYFSCGSDKYTKIKMCDLELASTIVIAIASMHPA